MTDVYKRGPDGLREAVEIAVHSVDLDAACELLQAKLGQDDGGLAGIVFSDGEVEANWSGMSDEARRAALEGYVATELAHAEDPDP